MKNIKYLIIGLFMFFPIIVSASGSITVNKSSISLESGGSDTFEVKAVNCTGKITFSSSDKNIVTIDKSSEWIDNNTIKVTVKSTGVGTATININVDAATYDEEVIKTNKSVTVKVNPPKSSNNNLSSLKVNGRDVNGFSQSTTTYKLGSTDETSVDITATPADSKSIVKGTGKKNLNYGKNTFKVTVTAENGSSKTYNIEIERNDNRNSDNNLSSLKVSGLDLKFNKNTLEYSFTVEHSISSIEITASANDSKAKVSGTGTKKLVDYENKFNVVVEAENGSKKTYKIIINRKNAQGALKELSSDTSIKSLTIIGYEIDFNSNKNTYYIEADKDVNKLDMEIKLSDSNAKYEIKNNSDFKDHINTVEIVVTSENGENRLYYINVLKKEIDEKIEEVKEEKVEEEKVEEEKSNFNIFIVISIVEFIGLIVLLFLLFNKKEDKIVENNEIKNEIN